MAPYGKYGGLDMAYNRRVNVYYYGIDGRSVRGFADMKQSLDRCARELNFGGRNQKLLAVGLRRIRDIISAHGLYATAEFVYDCGFNICCDDPGETEWLVNYDIDITVFKNKEASFQANYPRYKMQLDNRYSKGRGTLMDIHRMQIQNATERMCCEEWHNRIYKPLKTVEEPITDGVIRLIQSIRHEDELKRIRDAIDNQISAMERWAGDSIDKYLEQAKTRFDILAE